MVGLQPETRQMECSISSSISTNLPELKLFLGVSVEPAEGSISSGSGFWRSPSKWGYNTKLRELKLFLGVSVELAEPKNAAPLAPAPVFGGALQTGL